MGWQNKIGHPGHYHKQLTQVPVLGIKRICYKLAAKHKFSTAGWVFINGSGRDGW